MYLWTPDRNIVVILISELHNRQHTHTLQYILKNNYQH